jgi:hypothetical protein
MSCILSIAILLTLYLITGVVLVLAADYFHLLEGYPLSLKAAAVVAFALGMLHGRWRRLRRSSRISRDVR